MSDPTGDDSYFAPEPPVEPLEDIEFPEPDEKPLCRYWGHKASEPCWGEVAKHPDYTGNDSTSPLTMTCRGHLWMSDKGRYFSRETLLKARKTGGNLYPTFVSRTESPVPGVDPVFKGIWDMLDDNDPEKAVQRAERREEALATVKAALARTKLPRDPKNNPPPPSHPVVPPSEARVNLGMAVGEGGEKIVKMWELRDDE